MSIGIAQAPDSTPFERINVQSGRRSWFNLAFDVDAEALWASVAKGKNRPALTSQGQYGLHDGLPRILTMRDDLRIKATFFVPGMVAELHTTLVPELAAAGHEIASHAYTHVPLSFLESAEQERNELQRAKDILEGQTNQPVVGFGAPVSDVSVHTLDILSKQGMLYDRSFLDSDFPYLFRRADQSIVELPISWVLDDFAFFGHNLAPKMGWGIRAPEAVSPIWKGELEAIRAEGGFGCLVLHPEVIGRRPRMTMLRDLVCDLGAEFMTCAEIAASVTSMAKQ